uniref:Chloride channel protein n=1 Tax=Glossina brevipalpis TaxID=37001 RepID=A0A1A9WNW2_9MUSC
MEKRIKSKIDEKPLINYSDAEEEQTLTAVTFDKSNEESDDEILIGPKSSNEPPPLIVLTNDGHMNSEQPIVFKTTRTVPEKLGPSSEQVNLSTEPSTSQAAQQRPTFLLRSRTAAIHQANQADIYESLDYDVCENALFQAEQKRLSGIRWTSRKDIFRWIIFIQIGIITALVACTIDIIIEELSGLKYKFLKQSVDKNISNDGDLVLPYLYWLILSIIPVTLGAFMVTYIEPVTAGSGMPQVKCYLNGVKIPRVVRIKTMTVKAIGVITSVVGGLAGGKEGPMIHAGAVVAAGISQGKSTTFTTDFRIFKEFRDDHEKRDFVLGGAAAGVAAAFGAPIGGMLFSLEEAASFWNQNLIWRTLVASIISSFTLNVVLSAYHGLNDYTFVGLFNLGKFEQPLTFNYYELPIFTLYGITGGLLGAFWNMLNTRLSRFRERFIKAKAAKVFEATLVAMLGVSMACAMIYFINDCRPLGNDPTEYPTQLFCEDNEYNAVAALWFQTPEATVRSLFHDPPGSHKILTLTTFTLIYYMFSCLTFGLNVSLGVFIPTALVGAAWGRLVAMIVYYLFPKAGFLNPGKYALIGAAANLGGILRMTISLTVILMETTGMEPTFFFPIILTLISAKWVGDYFNEGIYDIQVAVNHVPMMPWEPLPLYRGLKASNIMSSPAICIKLEDKANYIYEILTRYKHNGFPVVEEVRENERSSGRVCGIILRSQLIVILLKKMFEEKKRFWEKEVSIQTFREFYPRFPSIENVQLHDDKVDYTVNLNIFMNPSPICSNEHESVPKIFNKFRALGLRHLI